MERREPITPGPRLTAEEYDRRFGKGPDVRKLMVPLSPEEAEMARRDLAMIREMGKGGEMLEEGADPSDLGGVTVEPFLPITPGPHLTAEQSQMVIEPLRQLEEGDFPETL